MFNFWKTFFCFAFAPLYLGGGGGKTETKTTTTTSNKSLQAGIGDNSTGVFGDGNVVQVLDGGAVAGALKLGTETIDAGVKMYKMAEDAKSSDYGKLLTTTQAAFEKMLAFGATTQSNAAALVDTANSKGTLDSRTIMTLGGGVLLVAVAYIFKRAA